MAYIFLCLRRRNLNISFWEFSSNWRIKKGFWGEIKSIFHHFLRLFSWQKLPQVLECAFKFSYVLIQYTTYTICKVCLGINKRSNILKRFQVKWLFNKLFGLYVVELFELIWRTVCFNPTTYYVSSLLCQKQPRFKQYTSLRSINQKR